MYVVDINSEYRYNETKPKNLSGYNFEVDNYTDLSGGARIFLCQNL